MFREGRTSAVSLLDTVDAVVESNTFRDNGSAGVYLQRAERPVVRLNTFVTDGLAVGTAAGGVVADNLFLGAGPTPWRVGGAGVLVERMVVVP